MTLLYIPASYGELFDKISILQIKIEKLTDKTALQNVNEELSALLVVRSNLSGVTDEVLLLADELKIINAQLWDIENEIRVKESRREFDSRFVTLARSVYVTNDKRSKIKRTINVLGGSCLVEEKSYAKY